MTLTAFDSFLQHRDNNFSKEVAQAVRSAWGLRIGGWREEEQLGLHLHKNDELALSESS
jgi:hypothetical protein